MDSATARQQAMAKFRFAAISISLSLVAGLFAYGMFLRSGETKWLFFGLVAAVVGLFAGASSANQIPTGIGLIRFVDRKDRPGCVLAAVVASVIALAYVPITLKVMGHAWEDANSAMVYVINSSALQMENVVVTFPNGTSATVGTIAPGETGRAFRRAAGSPVVLEFRWSGETRKEKCDRYVGKLSPTRLSIGPDGKWDRSVR